MRPGIVPLRLSAGAKRLGHLRSLVRYPAGQLTAKNILVNEEMWPGAKNKIRHAQNEEYTHEITLETHKLPEKHES